MSLYGIENFRPKRMDNRTLEYEELAGCGFALICYDGITHWRFRDGEGLTIDVDCDECINMEEFKLCIIEKLIERN